MTKILKFKKIENVISNTNNSNKKTIIPYNKTIVPLTTKEWEQKYLGNNRESKRLRLYLTFRGVITFLDQLLVPWELMPNDEKLIKEDSLGILYDQLEKFESVKNKEYPIRTMFYTGYKEKYFSDFKLQVSCSNNKITEESVLYLDMILTLLTKVLNSVFYVKDLASELHDNKLVVGTKDWIVLDHYECNINSVAINNKFMFELVFKSDWNIKRGLLKKLNKKSMSNFVNTIDSKHIFLW